MARITRSYQYIIGFYCCDGCFTKIRMSKLYCSWEEANDDCKRIQPYYNHRLLVRKEVISIKK